MVPARIVLPSLVVFSRTQSPSPRPEKSHTCSCDVLSLALLNCVLLAALLECSSSCDESCMIQEFFPSQWVWLGHHWEKPPLWGPLLPRLSLFSTEDLVYLRSRRTTFIHKCPDPAEKTRKNTQCAIVLFGTTLERLRIPFSPPWTFARAPVVHETPHLGHLFVVITTQNPPDVGIPICHLRTILKCGVGMAKQPDIPLLWAEAQGFTPLLANEVDDSEGRDREQVGDEASEGKRTRTHHSTGTWQWDEMMR